MTLSKPCARGGCTGTVQATDRFFFDRRKFCSRRCGALGRRTTRLLPEPQPCQRPGCDQLGKPRYCSRKCAGIVNAAAKPHTFFVQLGQMGCKARRQRGTHALRPHEERLMAAGRFFEAARSIYDRAYSAGHMAGKTGRRQLPPYRAYPSQRSA
jgi:hypothetical protein